MPPKPSNITWQQRNEWEAAQQAMINTKLLDVAALLGFEVHSNNDYRSQILRCGTVALYCYFDAWHNRLNISDYMPYEFREHRITSGNHPDPNCAITVNPDRPAAAIASDIQRRLLPVYEKLYADLEERHAKHTSEKDSEMSLAQRIAAAGRGHVQQPTIYRAHDPFRRPVAVFGAHPLNGAYSGPHGSAEVSAYGKLHAKMTLYDVPPELAEFIASLLGEWADQ